MNPLAANPGFAYRLALIVDGVCRVVAGHIGRDRTAGPTIILVCNDIRRRFLRLAKLMEQVQLGILPRTPLRPRAPAAAASGAGAYGARAGGHVRVPRAKGFLLKLMRAAPWEVAVFGSQLQYWLTDPAASSFVSSYPQARRILRPIWRMLSRDPLPAVLREPAREPAGATEVARDLSSDLWPDPEPSPDMGRDAAWSGPQASAPDERQDTFPAPASDVSADRAPAAPGRSETPADLQPDGPENAVVEASALQSGPDCPANGMMQAASRVAPNDASYRAAKDSAVPDGPGCQAAPERQPATAPPRAPPGSIPQP